MTHGCLESDEVQIANFYSSVPSESDMRYAKMSLGQQARQGMGGGRGGQHVIVQSQATAFGSRDNGWQAFMSALLLQTMSQLTSAN